jgi:hypothetical protein
MSFHEHDNGIGMLAGLGAAVFVTPVANDAVGSKIKKLVFDLWDVCEGASYCEYDTLGDWGVTAALALTIYKTTKLLVAHSISNARGGGGPHFPPY